MEIHQAFRIVANPDCYYVNLHTTDNPPGEVRAQLRLPAETLTRRQSRDIERLSAQVRSLTMMLSDIEGNLNELASQERLDQLNRIDENVAAIGRRQGLNTMSQQVAGSAR